MKALTYVFAAMLSVAILSPTIASARGHERHMDRHHDHRDHHHKKPSLLKKLLR